MTFDTLRDIDFKNKTEEKLQKEGDKLFSETKLEIGCVQDFTPLRIAIKY